MYFNRLAVLLIVVLCSISKSRAQSFELPVAIQVLTENRGVAPGDKSYVTIQYKIPEGLWIGSFGNEGRVPPRTKITTPNIEGFTFEKPIFPESTQDWIPVKLGKTRVYKEEVNVIVPFTVSNTVKEDDYNLAFELSYTPGYSAGRLTTHNNEVYSTSLRVDRQAETVSIPSPSTGKVGSDFKVKPKNFDHINKPFRFIFQSFDEERGIAKTLHNIWLDPPNHGKSIRFSPVPFLDNTNFGGSSTGLGGSFFNATSGGIVTGSLSASAYANDFIGYGFGVGAVSCPGAYHNYQFSANFGGEGFRNVTLDYENFTIANYNLGLNVSLQTQNEPRARFVGFGPGTEDEDGTAYRSTRLHGLVDVFVLPIQNFRFGVGLEYDNYGVGLTFDELAERDEGAVFLQNTPLADGLIGLNGGTLFGVRANFIYDRRDQEFASSKGFYISTTLSRNSISDVSDAGAVDGYNGLDVDFRQYFSGPSQDLIVVLRGALSLKSESQIPFDLTSVLGGVNSLRAYDLGRFRGQHAAYVSGEFRYTIGNLPILGYPLSVEAGAFLDVGQVFGDGDTLGDELNIDPGISLRLINKPNVGFVYNYAFGRDGGYLSGGIVLPF